ncbi:hypothetical protein BKA70DRAFT_1444874 [Coprinopsis sp. MPI-PUGE-AT-0042]|nr:hypothetical protein BKA70DRAFT_1444874 [Coprinopsis sp. MPI-PUGE-AT-0042]
MLDFTVLADSDWASFLDFLSLRIMLALRVAGEGRDTWQRLKLRLAAEVDNACFCMAVAHFHSSTLRYSSEFMSLLSKNWVDIFLEADVGVHLSPPPHPPCSDTDAHRERSTESRDKSVMPTGRPDPALDSGIAVPPPSGSDLKSGDGPIHDKTMPQTPNDSAPMLRVELNILPLEEALKDCPIDADVPHAWWHEREPATPPLNPLSALQYWREYQSKRINVNAPIPVIWPLKHLLSLWESYCDALDEVKEPQGTHIQLVYEGGVAKTAELVDCVVKAALYPLFPNLHRTDKPHDPCAVADLLDI